MKTRNGRAVKTSNGVVYVREDRDGKRGKWHECGNVWRKPLGGWAYAYQGETREAVRRDLACLSLAQNYEFSVLDRKAECSERAERIGERYAKAIATPFPTATMEAQDDEADAEAYADAQWRYDADEDQRTETVGDLRVKLYEAFLEGRRTAR